MNKKAEKFDAFLQENKVPWFTKEEHSDEFNSVVFGGRLEAASQQFPLFVILDDSVFSFVRIIVTTAPVAPEQRAAVAMYLSELNSKFKIFKYYIGEEDGAVYLDISFPSSDEDFNPGLLLQLIGQVLLPHVEEFYPQLMQTVWGRNVETPAAVEEAQQEATADDEKAPSKQSARKKAATK